MKVPTFELERWQSIWEHRAELNVAESGVEPLRLEELVEPDELGRLMSLHLGYPQTNGSAGLRERIAALYPGADASNVLVTSGCAEANFLATWSLVEPGDEVVCVHPNYLQIAGLARGFGATVKPWWLRESAEWQPDPDELRGLVSDRTRVIAVCNPNNPTGAVLDERTVEEILTVARRVGAHVIADEVYRGAELDGKLTETFWSRHDRLLCTAGLSKAYGLPGLRVGWIVGPAEAIDRLWSYHDYTTISPTVLSDALAASALEPRRRAAILERTRKILARNYPLVRDWIERSDGSIRHVPPRAGAVAWVAHHAVESSDRLARELLRRKGVLVVPAEQFGMKSYLRIGFGGEAGPLREALERIEEMLGEGF